MRRSVRRFGAAVATAVMILSLGATVAFAGETTGSGGSLKVEDSKWGTGLHSRSFCAYSGLNDEISPADPGRVQNWGSIPKAARDQMRQFGFLPGQACNPNIGPPHEG